MVTWGTQCINVSSWHECSFEMQWFVGKSFSFRFHTSHGGRMWNKSYWYSAYQLNRFKETRAPLACSYKKPRAFAYAIIDICWLWALYTARSQLIKFGNRQILIESALHSWYDSEPRSLRMEQLDVVSPPLTALPKFLFYSECASKDMGIDQSFMRECWNINDNHFVSLVSCSDS